MSRLMSSVTSLALRPALALAATIAATPAAHAGTTVTFGSGVNCTQAYAEEGQTTTFHDGGLYSFATSGWRTAICPLNQQTALALRASAAVDVVDMHYTEPVTCRIMMSGVSTNAVWVRWGAAVTSTGSSPVPQRLNVAYDGGASSVGRDFVMCYLPAVYAGNRSGVVAYEGTHQTWP